eukprot:SAG25_NODE_2501_length_1566_cov_1.918882_2_plen_70_part_00
MNMNLNLNRSQKRRKNRRIKMSGISNIRAKEPVARPAVFMSDGESEEEVYEETTTEEGIWISSENQSIR